MQDCYLLTNVKEFLGDKKIQLSLFPQSFDVEFHNPEIWGEPHTLSVDPPVKSLKIILQR